MPVLLLARGDQVSRSMLKQAIEARYGHSAPMIETTKIDLKGRSRVKLPFTTTWMPVEATVYVKFPSAIRWDFTMRPVGLPVSNMSEAFDGSALRRTRVLRSSEVNTDTGLLHSLRARLWSMAVMLLTPLPDPSVEVRMLGETTLVVENTQTDIRVNLQLNADKTVHQIGTVCFNPLTEKEQIYTLRATHGQELIGDIMFPRQIEVLWDDEVESELNPVSIETNLSLDDSFFRI